MNDGLPIAIIPARGQSTRFPRKILAPILNKPMIQYVWDLACRAERISKVLVATDDVEIKQTIEGLGGTAVLTPSELPSGTDRVALVAKDLNSDIIVNVQGDEPLLPPAAIDRLVEALEADPHCEMATLAVRQFDRQQLLDPNVVKVVVNRQSQALYFSRQPIASDPDGSFLKHIGIYAYRKKALLRLCQLPAGKLELAERLEQLRALENNIVISVAQINEDTIAVDTPGDIPRVEAILKSKGNN